MIQSSKEPRHGMSKKKKPHIDLEKNALYTMSNVKMLSFNDSKNFRDHNFRQLSYLEEFENDSL